MTRKLLSGRIIKACICERTKIECDCFRVQKEPFWVKFYIPFMVFCVSVLLIGLGYLFRG